MRRVFLILSFILVFFLLEALFFNLSGGIFNPKLSILLVIFINLALGIRYSLLTAVCSGLLEDSFSSSPFGIYLFAFVVCAYMTTFLQKLFYARGSDASRLVLVFLIYVVYFSVVCTFKMMQADYALEEAFAYILLPQGFATLIVTPFIFTKLKQCASKVFVY